jgi:hypothetical protein
MFAAVLNNRSNGMQPEVLGSRQCDSFLQRREKKCVLIGDFSGIDCKFFTLKTALNVLYKKYELAVKSLSHTTFELLLVSFSVIE